MDLIGGLFARYQKLLRDKELESGLIGAVIKEETGLTVPNDSYKLKDGCLSLKVKPKYKLEILLKKDRILFLLEERGLKVYDLR